MSDDGDNRHPHLTYQTLIEMTNDFKCVAEIRIQGTDDLTNIQDHLDNIADDPESNIKDL